VPRTKQAPKAAMETSLVSLFKGSS